MTTMSAILHLSELLIGRRFLFPIPYLLRFLRSSTFQRFSVLIYVHPLRGRTDRFSRTTSATPALQADTLASYASSTQSSQRHRLNACASENFGSRFQIQSLPAHTGSAPLLVALRNPDTPFECAECNIPTCSPRSQRQKSPHFRSLVRNSAVRSWASHRWSCPSAAWVAKA